jgi:chromate reductase, NAD(P)H dehydrogenase (quinone)
MKIIGLCASLRSASLNRSLLRLAGESLPAEATLEIADWSCVPAFNADLLAKGWPPAVAELRERIRDADAVLVATPEYNFSLPGMFKNLLDWLSRGDDQPFSRKPVAILTASPGPVGGTRVQYDLRKVMLFMDAMVLAKPEVFVTSAASKFDPAGLCIDDTTRRFVADQMKALIKWTNGVSQMPA